MHPFHFGPYRASCLRRGSGIMCVPAASCRGGMTDEPFPGFAELPDHSAAEAFAAGPGIFEHDLVRVADV